MHGRSPASVASSNGFRKTVAGAVGRRARAWAVFASALCVGCGDSDTGTSLQLDVFEEATYLRLQDNDVRTAHFFRVRLSTENGRPVTGLTRRDFTFIRDEEPSTSENNLIPTGSLARVDVNLCLDNSNSLLDDDDPSDGVDRFVETLRERSKTFVQALAQNDSVERLRLFRFSTASRTVPIGEFVASSTAASGYSPDPGPVIDDQIRPGPDDSGTSFFFCLEQSFNAVTPGRQTLHVIFSDGIEEGSPVGARNRVLERINDNQLKVYALGIGNVQSQDLRAVSPFGRSFIRDDVLEVGQLFDEVVKDVESLYAIVYDSPLQEGRYDLTMDVGTGTRQVVYRTSFDAGIDLIRQSYAIAAVPNSAFTYTRDGLRFRYRVLPFSPDGVDADGRLLVGIDVDDGGNGFDGTADFFSGPFGAGEIRRVLSSDRPFLVLPPDLSPNREWEVQLPDGDGRIFVYRLRSGPREERLTVGEEQLSTLPVELLDAKTEALVLRAWYARGIGLVRLEEGDSVTSLEQYFIPDTF